MFTINQNLIDDFADKINEKEKKSNKVTSLSSESTDTEYPSAKAVYDNISSATTAINNRITNLNEGTINIVGTPYNQLGGATATSLVTLLHNIDNNFGDILFCAYNVGGTADAFTISGTGGFGNLTSNHPFILLAYNWYLPSLSYTPILPVTKTICPSDSLKSSPFGILPLNITAGITPVSSFKEK